MCVKKSEFLIKNIRKNNINMLFIARIKLNYKRGTWWSEIRMSGAKCPLK